MGKNRLEAFSDGVLAIIITIMVLELKVPHGEGLEVLRPLLPIFCSYVLSFVYVAIYWNNHHHLLHAAHHVNGAILWANMHLLFWLSLVPFVTGFMGESHLSPLSVALYGVVLFMAGFAYYLLVRALIRRHGPESTLARAIGKDVKGNISMVAYILAIPVAFVWTPAALFLFTAVAVLWLIPDRRIERVIGE